MKLTFLGTGTSTGVPMIGCRCAVCRSTDPHDKRMRSSALVTTDKAAILIDCGPDFRQQALQHNITRLDAILLTHEHYDHVGGLDDVRAIPQKLDVFANRRVMDAIHRVMPYCFGKQHYPGSAYLNLNQLNPYQQFKVKDADIEALPIIHHTDILGYKIGHLGYITDCKTMPDATIQSLKGIDTLVLNALRIEPHPTHLSLSEAISLASEIGARQTFFTHFSHNLGLHAEIEPTLPEGMHLAFDGLTIEF